MQAVLVAGVCKPILKKLFPLVYRFFRLQLPAVVNGFHQSLCPVLLPVVGLQNPVGFLHRLVVLLGKQLPQQAVQTVAGWFQPGEWLHKRKAGDLPKIRPPASEIELLSQDTEYLFIKTAGSAQSNNPLANISSNVFQEAVYEHPFYFLCPGNLCKILCLQGNTLSLGSQHGIRCQREVEGMHFSFFHPGVLDQSLL